MRLFLLTRSSWSVLHFGVSPLHNLIRRFLTVAMRPLPIILCHARKWNATKSSYSIMTIILSLSATQARLSVLRRELRRARTLLDDSCLFEQILVNLTAFDVTAGAAMVDRSRLSLNQVLSKT